ncbi:MAG TPA: YggT family protein [Candidatus Dormibacteraeota bacterium]
MHLAAVLVNDLAFLLEIYALCILAWAFMTFFPSAYATPVGHLLESLVMPIIRPLRRLLPTIAGLDFSPLLALVLVFAAAELLRDLASNNFADPLSAIFSVVFEFISAVILVIFVLLLIRVLIGILHVDPWHPFVFSIRRITDAFVTPIQRAARVQVEAAAVIGLIASLVVYIVLAQILFPTLLDGLQRV